MSMSLAVQIGWITYAICWLALISYIFYYKTPSYLPFIFLAAGVSASVNFHTQLYNIWRYCLQPIAGGDYSLLVPLAFGLTMLGIFSREWNWVPRYAYTITVGATIGLGIFASINSTIIGLAADSIQPIFGVDYATALGNILLMIGCLTGIACFIFTREQKGPLGWAARIGRYFVMGTIGMAFSSLFLGGFTNVNGLIQNIVQNALHLIGP